MITREKEIERKIETVEAQVHNFPRLDFGPVVGPESGSVCVWNLSVTFARQRREIIRPF